MSDLPWWRWLTMTNEAIKALGYDPTLRYNLTGHNRKLSKTWARTVGMWGLHEAREIMVRAGKNPTRHRSAYDLFKYRHHLKTRRQLAKTLRSHGGPLVLTYEQFHIACLVSNLIVPRVDEAERAQKNGSDMIMGDLYCECGDKYGILPIEAKLYYEATFEIVAQNVLTWTQWDRLNLSARKELWDRGAHNYGTLIGPPDELLSSDDEDDTEA